MDAVTKANSGHPGLPLGCADFAAYLYAEGLRYNPKNPSWYNRDRFVLSAGHGSMLLYASLHLSGYDISLDDIRSFRQLGSKLAGHPEYGHCPGIEATTGPLGQGVAMGVGIALAYKMSSARFDKGPYRLSDATTYVLAGDGCLMEGVSAEASSLAGHLGLDNLVIFYDNNSICLDGSTSECFSENVHKRYESYGWCVHRINGHDFIQIEEVFQSIKKKNGKPFLVIMDTVIGYGSPNAGSSEIHGKPMSREAILETKKVLGLSLDEFYVHPDVYQYFESYQKKLSLLESCWEKSFLEWSVAYPNLRSDWDAFLNKDMSIDLSKLDVDVQAISTRKASNILIQSLSKQLPYLIGGSADLSSSDATFIKDSGVISFSNYLPKNIKYGVREFAMASIASGLWLHGHYRPFCGTFLVFSDYMKNAIRLAALMELPVIYQLTHDSLFLGEDGPTHQPIEHLAALRSMPNIIVLRPADFKEVLGAWKVAFQSKLPIALVLSRQDLPCLASTSSELVSKGAYIVLKESKNYCDLCIFSTGSELHLALELALSLQDNWSVRVVSFPSFELFDSQNVAYRESVISDASKYCVIEAQSSFGWHKYAGRDPICFTVDKFGSSAPMQDLKETFSFSKEYMIKIIKESLSKLP